MRDLTITLFQVQQYWEDKKKNIDHLALFFNKDFETDLILLPEMFNTGFSMRAELLAEPHDSSKGIEQLKSWAKQKGAAIYTSLLIKENKSYYNRGCFVYPSGEVLHYDKRYLFSLSGENTILSSGSSPCIVDYLGWKLNLQICYDLRFPACAQNYMDASSQAAYDVLLYVANWPAKRINHWEKLLCARAIENQSYVVGINRIGRDGNGLEYDGSSVVNDFNGETLLDCKKNEEVIKSITINGELLSTYRTSLPFLADVLRNK